MDSAGWVAIISAIGVALAALLKSWWDGRLRERELDATIRRQDRAEERLNRGESDREVIWRGLLERGFLLAEQNNLIQKTDADYIISDKRAHDTYRAKARELQSVNQTLAATLRREPSNSELGWAIEKEFQDWLLQHACRALEVGNFECLVLAVIVAREVP